MPAPPPPPPADTTGAYGPSLAGSAVISRIDTGAIAPIHSPTISVPQYASRHFPPARHIATGDFNGDGLKDIVTCPSYFSSKPKMACEFWLNRGGGRFSLGTSEVVDGPLPLIAGTNSLFVADFNGDGRDDVVALNQGIEGKDPNDLEVDREVNIVFLSQPNGKLRDTTATSLPVNPPGFHHPSSMGDLDGDGDLDMAVCELGGKDRSGVFLLVNDGQGRFTRETASLPEELRSNPRGAPLLAGEDYLGCGSVVIADLDGDGRPEIAAATYIGGTWPSVQRVLRIYKRGSGGQYTRAAQIPLPASFGPTGPGSGNQVGVSHLLAGDLNGDGRRDLVVWGEAPWGASNHLVILRNEGGLAFSDVSVASLGSTQPWGLYGGSLDGGGTTGLVDLNGDGHLDIVLYQALQHPQLANYSPFLLNDGQGRFKPWVPLIGGTRYRGTGGLNDAQWVSLLGIPYTNPTALLMFDATGDGKPDWVFYDGLVPNPGLEPARLINGSYVDFVVFLRVVRQLP